MLVGVTVATCLVLAGCTGTAPVEPRPSATSEESPTATPTPTAEAITPPERPAEMDRTDEVGAIAAAEYFMRLAAYTFESGDLTEWDLVSSGTCGFCANIREDVLAIYDDGGAVDRSTVDVGRGLVLAYDESLVGYAVEIAYTLGPAVEYGPDGTPTQEIEAESGVAVLDVAPVHYGWQLLEVSSGGAGA